jgi:hypothetical protein
MSKESCLKLFVFLILAVLLAGCFRMGTAGYDAATDQRSMGKQVDEPGPGQLLIHSFFNPRA